MNVDELSRLSSWFIGHFSNLQTLYSRLIQPIQHNASQPNKQPLEAQLDGLIDYLHSITFEELSLQQIQLLDNLGVSEYIGADGAIFVEKTIRTSDYDPQTALNKLNEAVRALTEANNGFSAYIQSLNTLGIAVFDQEDSEGITIRIGFRKDASINNVSDFREAGKDWYDIIRGIAIAANEAPEDTKITGATTGSIILILAGTAAVTKILAMISKNVAAVAKDAIEIAHQIEDLRGKKLLNNVIERELRKTEQKKKEAANVEILKAISEDLPNLDGEQKTALEVSIKKLLSFNEKGGNVDFVAPEENEEGDSDEPSPTSAALAQVRAAIHEYQQVREQIKLLEDQSS